MVDLQAVRPRIAMLLGVLGLCSACKPPAANVDPELTQLGKQRDAIAIHQHLEQLIVAGRDTEADRELAYQSVQGRDDGTTAYAFARAAIAGRLAEVRGMQAGHLVTEAERYARQSIELDETFNDRAATRMLGTLYVLAPARLLEHGDSEEGLELLEGLVEIQPENLQSRLRLVEAYIALGDPEPAFEHLCIVVGGRDDLRADDRDLLARLIVDVGGEDVMACPAGAEP